MSPGQQTPSLYEVRIASDSLIEQLGRSGQLLPWRELGPTSRRRVPGRAGRGRALQAYRAAN